MALESEKINPKIITLNSTGIPIPAVGIPSEAIGSASKKFAELGIKKKQEEDFDPTDNDPHCLYDLAKVAIENGAKVKEIDLEKLAPHFKEDAKQKAKKYNASKVAQFFGGTGFMWIIYMFIEFLKTVV